MSFSVALTQYGYDNDPDGDTLTEEGWGAFGNKLSPASCALKRSTAKELGAIPRCCIKITLSPSNSLFRWWDDVVPESDKGERCDLYQPKGFDSTLPDRATIEVWTDGGNIPAQPV